MPAGLKPIEESSELDWFIGPARSCFDFLVEEFGFELLGVLEEPRMEFELVYMKSGICVSPFISCSLVGTGVGRFDPEKDAEPSATGMHMLERLRCPEIRLLPDERDRFEGATLHSVFSHDARVLREHFPDVLAGTTRFLKSESLPDDWQAQLSS